MDITIIGLGYVGLVNAIFLASLGNNIVGYDIDKNKISLLREGVVSIEEVGLQDLLDKFHKNLRFTSNYKDSIRNADNIFICVDTPSKEDGSVDLSNFYNVLDNIKNASNKDQNIIIKSTVPIGQNKLTKQYLEKDSLFKYEVISFPEFLSQGKALEGLINPYRMIFGVSSSNGANVAKRISQAYLTKKVPVMITSSENAELIKYASNCFLATKISYINNISQLCKACGADINKVSKAMSLDPRIGSEFLNAGIGFGGSCFPKDTKALINIEQRYGVDNSLLKSVMKINDDQISIFMNEFFSKFKRLSNLKIGILGVAFKGDCEDVRNSQATVIMRMLLDKNAKLTVYDPLAMDNCENLFSRHQHIKYVDYISDVLKDADVVFILNDCNEFKELKAYDFISLMKKPIIFDGRNLFKLEDMIGIEYHSIGRNVVLIK